MRTRLESWYLLAASVLMLGGCVKKASIGPNGYDQPVFRYRFSYQDRARGLFFGPDWRIDNYFGEPGSYKAKWGPDYVATRELDANADGIISDWEKKEEPIYDLRFVNIHDDGIIWIKAHPLTPQTAQKDLDVLLNNYADGLAGTGLYAQSNLFSVEHVRARQFTSFVVSKEAGTMANNAALVGVIELAESERLRIDPQFRSAKIKIALARFAYYETVGSNWSSFWPVVKYRGQDRYQRIGLLVVGYYNTASKFDAQVHTFDQALAQLSFEPESALAGPAAPAAPAAGSVVAPSATSPVSPSAPGPSKP